jgi:uncharacterized protein (DUF3084 family)
MEDQRIINLKKQIQDLYSKKSKLRNEVAKLDIDYKVLQLKKEIEKIEREPKNPVQKVQQQKVEFKKEEKKEEKKPEGTPDLNRGKVAEPGSTIPDNHKKDDKREEKKEDNKKN